MPGSHRCGGHDGDVSGTQVSLQGQGSCFLKTGQVHFHHSRHICKVLGTASYCTTCLFKGTGTVHSGLGIGPLQCRCVCKDPSIE